MSFRDVRMGAGGGRPGDLRKVLTLFIESKCGTKQAPTCVLPMHALQKSDLWREVQWGGEKGYNQGYYESLPRGIGNER